jgi:predicted permease
MLRAVSTAGEWRQAARSLRRTPVYAATVILVTALSMALASTVFAVVDGVLFKSLPYPNADELYVVSGRHDGGAPLARGVAMTSPNEVAAWAAAAPGVTITTLGYTSVQLPDGTILNAVAADRSFFGVFGIRLLMGGFREEHYVGERPVTPVVISHRVWQERFNGDPGVVGRSVRPFSSRLRPFEIVGVMESEAFFPPLPAGPDGAARRPTRIDAVRPAFTQALGERSGLAFARIPIRQLAQAQAALGAAVAVFRAAAPAPRARLSPAARQYFLAYDRVDLIPLGAFVASRERPAFALAFGMAMSLVVLVLLNAGALAAARAQHRIRDLALRRALGARLGDLIRHALAEQVLLAGAGAAIGLALAPTLLALVLERLPPGLTLVKDVRLDWRVLAFAGLLSAATAFAVAVISVVVAERRASMGHGLLGDLEHTPARMRLGHLLVAGQTAIAFALVLGGALFATSLARVWREDPGLRVDHVATMDLRFRDPSISSHRPRALEVVRRLREVPGVLAAGLFDAPLMQNSRVPDSFLQVPQSAVERSRVAPVRVSSGFFAAAGIQPLSGRLPSDAELDAGAPVVVVTETAARAWWPDRPAIGQTVRAGRGARAPLDTTVIGIVPELRLVALDVPSDGVVLVPWSLPVQGSYYACRLYIVLDPGSPGALSRVVDGVAAIDPAAVPADVQWLADAIADSIRERRLGALAASTFGIVALVFVALGLLGLVTMTSSRRTREVGIRLALGAARGDVARLLVLEQIGAVAGGLAAGALLTAWLVRVLSARLYGVGVYDVSVWVPAVVVIVATAGFSAWLPAARASRVDPVITLRHS